MPVKPTPELKQRANDVLKKASAFVVSGDKPSKSIVVTFNGDDHAQFGIDPIVRVLATTSKKIALSKHYTTHRSLN